MFASTAEATLDEKATEEVKAVIVEDEQTDKELIEGKLKSAGIVTTSFDTLEPISEVKEAARGARIVSLDLQVDGDTGDSVALAGWLIKNNPFSGIFILTKAPDVVIRGLPLPVNFVVKKRSAAEEMYGQTSLNIMVHDTSLSLLRAIRGLLIPNPLSEITISFEQFAGELRNFCSLLPSIIRTSRHLDNTGVSNYQELLSELVPIVEGQLPGPGQSSEPTLLSLRQPLFKGVFRMRRELEGTEGVRVNPKLSEEVVALEAALSCPEAHTAVVMEARPSDAPSGGEVEATLFLNVWLPECPKNEPWIYVGRPTDLLVNLGPPRDPEAAGKTDSISEDAAEKLREIGYVDVMAMCPDADIVPLRSRLHLPPRGDEIAQFTVTPQRPGSLSITVLLLVRNDPIHRTILDVLARQGEDETNENETTPKGTRQRSP